MAPCKRGSEKPNAVISDILAKYFQSHSPMYKKLQNLLFQMRFRSIFFSL